MSPSRQRQRRCVLRQRPLQPLRTFAATNVQYVRERTQRRARVHGQLSMHAAARVLVRAHVPSRSNFSNDILLTKKNFFTPLTKKIIKSTEAQERNYEREPARGATRREHVCKLAPPPGMRAQIWCVHGKPKPRGYAHRESLNVPVFFLFFFFFFFAHPKRKKRQRSRVQVFRGTFQIASGGRGGRNKLQNGVWPALRTPGCR